jgi:hypothetical protein
VNDAALPDDLISKLSVFDRDVANRDDRMLEDAHIDGLLGQQLDEHCQYSSSFNQGPFYVFSGDYVRETPGSL